MIFKRNIQLSKTIKEVCKDNILTADKLAEIYSKTHVPKAYIIECCKKMDIKLSHNIKDK